MQLPEKIKPALFFLPVAVLIGFIVVLLDEWEIQPQDITGQFKAAQRSWYILFGVLHFCCFAGQACISDADEKCYQFGYNFFIFWRT